MKTEAELFENALDTTSVNGKKLREYINENYISNSVLGKIRNEMENSRDIQNAPYDVDYYSYLDGVDKCLGIIDKYMEEQNVKDH